MGMSFQSRTMKHEALIEHGFQCKSTCYIEGWIAASAIGLGVAGIAGAAIEGSAAESAANTQAGAAENAQGIQQGMFNTQVGNESPYMEAGYGAQSQLDYLLGIGTPGTAQKGAGATGTPGTASSSTAGGYGSLLTPFTANYM